MKEVKNLKIDYLKKIKKGASLCIRKKYLHLFEDEEVLYKTPFSLHKYKKLGKYETFQLEASIKGNPTIVASLQSKTGKENLETLYKLILAFKEIKKTLHVLKNKDIYKKNLKKLKFKKNKK